MPAMTLGEIFRQEAEAKARAAETAREERLRHVREDLEWLALDARPTMARGDAEDVVDEIVGEIQARLLGIAPATSKVADKKQDDDTAAKEGT